MFSGAATLFRAAKTLFRRSKTLFAGMKTMFSLVETMFRVIVHHVLGSRNLVTESLKCVLDDENHVPGDRTPCSEGSRTGL
jgi:hypothetical protein